MPDDGGDAGAWGAILNDLFDDEIEADIDTVEATADAALPVAGGTMTGEILVKSESHTGVNKGSMTGGVTIDLDNGDCFYGTVTGNVTSITLSNWPTSGRFEFVLLEITNGSAFTITWPAAIDWHEATEPTLQASGKDVILLYSRDAGTTVIGSHVWASA